MIKAGTARKRILVIDDEPAVCQLCRRALAEGAFEVDVASDGRAAQSMITEHEYDLYLLDIRMPRMSGKELYEWLEKAYPRSAAMVVFITGSAMGPETQMLLEASGRLVLPKPFTAGQLAEVVGETLNTAKERK